uniref:Uncharacterized protein n=1 Tax=Anguilla anguilla TaxID=7936 RepID=A0A0E9V0J9_ANGAN
MKLWPPANFFAIHVSAVVCVFRNCANTSVPS